MKTNFLHRPIKIDKDGCWLWSGSKDTEGYGLIRVDGILMKAHRVSYVVFKNEIPKGLNILHSCSKKACVNPDHLRAGTQKENIQEEFLNNRHPSQKLSPNDVRDIRERIEDGEVLTYIAKYYGVGVSCISSIKHRRLWGFLDG